MIWLFWILYFSFWPTQNLVLEVHGFDHDEGQALIRLSDAEGHGLDSLILGIENGAAYYTFVHLPAGQYAIAAFHDQNSNGQLDRNILGIPQEKYGFSNNARAPFSAPPLQEQLFSFPNEQKIEIWIK